MSHPALNAAVRLYLKAKGLPIKKPKVGARWIPGAIFAYERGPDRFVLVQVQDAIGTVKTLTRTYGPEELTKRLMLTAAAAMQLRPNPKKRKTSARKSPARKRAARKPKKGSTPRQYINRPSQTTKAKPTKRLKKRRAKNIAQGRTGSYPNPKRRKSVPYGAKVIFV